MRVRGNEVILFLWHSGFLLICKAEKTERGLENFYKHLMDAFSFIHLVFVNFCRVLFFSVFSAPLILIALYKNIEKMWGYLFSREGCSFLRDSGFVQQDFCVGQGTN